MFSQSQCSILITCTVLISFSYPEWVEISVQNKLRYTTTEKSHGFANPQHYSRTSTTKTYPDVFLSTTTKKCENPEPKNKMKTRSEGKMEEQKIEENSAKEKNDVDTNFFSMVQQVQKDLLENPHKKLKNKVNILVNLKDKLLSQIQYRLSGLWPSSEENEAREYQDDSYLTFPSNEAAMLTIGFLTFAVFLIKLVLKIIHVLKYKNQYYSYTPTTIVATTMGKKKRSIQEGLEDEEILKIMESIQGFRDKYSSNEHDGNI